jgi:glucosamine-phosphate N-acetyltransferase
MFRPITPHAQFLLYPYLNYPSEEYIMAVSPPNDRPSQQNRITSQSRLVRALVNPNEVISELLPQPKQREQNASRLEDSKLARAIGGTGFDYGIGGSPDQARELPPGNEPLADVEITADVESRLPPGYKVRSLQREDFDNGYTHLKHVGVISRDKWDRRCEYLRSRSDTYIVLVITNSENWVVCSGTLVIERKFTHDLCLVGHVEDLLVGDGQNGKNLGGRILEALDQVAKDMGCYKTMVGTTESNEEFHRERSTSLPAAYALPTVSDSDLTFAGFKRGGIEMSHHHFAPRKTVPPRASSRDPSPDHLRYDSSSELGDKEPAVDVVATSPFDNENAVHI